MLQAKRCLKDHPLAEEDSYICTCRTLNDSTATLNRHISWSTLYHQVGPYISLAKTPQFQHIINKKWTNLFPILEKIYLALLVIQTLHPNFQVLKKQSSPIINLLLNMNLHACDLSVWQKSICMQLITVQKAYLLRNTNCFS